jgi:hypothetical protein
MTSCAFMVALAQLSKCESFVGKTSSNLTDAGFTAVQVLDDDVSQWGILHKHPWSLPILARRPLE